MSMGSQARGQRDHPSRGDLHAFIDRECSPARHLQLAQHLCVCPPCSATLQTIQQCAAGLEALEAPPATDHLVSRILARIAELPRPQRHLRIVAPLLFTIAVSLAFAWLPLAGRALKGIARWGEPPALSTADISELLLWVAAATWGGVGRAMDGLLAPVARVPAFGFLPSFLPLATAGMLATMLAGATLWVTLRRGARAD